MHRALRQHVVPALREPGSVRHRRSSRVMLVAMVAVSCVTGVRSIDAQRPTVPVARHRATYHVIERRLGRYRRADADMDSLGLEPRSTDGGRLTAYCEGAAIRLLVADYFGESGDATDRFYFDHDSLFFVFSQSRRGHPDGKDPYPARTIVEDQRFYFVGDRLIHWLEPNGKPQNVTSRDAEEQGRQLLADARRLRAAMPGCQPRYALP